MTCVMLAPRDLVGPFAMPIGESADSDGAAVRPQFGACRSDRPLDRASREVRRLRASRPAEPSVENSGAHVRKKWTSGYRVHQNYKMARTKTERDMRLLPGFAEFHARHGLLRIGEVMSLIGLRSRTSVYALVRAGELPPPVKIGRRASAWRAADVVQFIETRQVDPLARPPRQKLAEGEHSHGSAADRELEVVARRVSGQRTV